MQSHTPIKRSRVLGLAFIAFLVVFVLWQTSSTIFISALILSPLRLFVTFVHETAHGLTGILTGGVFLHFQVYPNGAGVAYTAGGNRFLILQAGYVGAALFGGVLLVAANRMRRVNVLSALMGAYMTGSALLFSQDGRTVLFLGFGVAVVLWLLGEHYRKYSGPLWILAWLTLIGTVVVILGGNDRVLAIGLLGGVALMMLGIFASRSVIIFVLNLIAFATGLNAISDIWVLTQLPNGVASDAAMLQGLTNVPALVWAGMWIVIAVVIMGVAAYMAFIQRDSPEMVTS